MPQDWSTGPFFEPIEHYALLRHAVGLNPGGTALEFGVGSGQSTRIIAKAMPVIGFDGFTGLQEDWRPEFPRGSFAFDPPQIDNAELVIGPFAETLPNFEPPADVGLLHLDADTYQATRTALAHVGRCLRRGSLVIFDEFWNYDDGPGAAWVDHEYRAWKEFAEETGIEWTVIGSSHEAWAIRIS